jgi:hypothetical protein
MALIIKAIGDRPINLMRLCAHGDSGRLFLGCYDKGMDDMTAYEEFQKLRPYFDRRPGAARREIKVHACSLGSDEKSRCVRLDDIPLPDGSRGFYMDCRGGKDKGVYDNKKDIYQKAGYSFLRGLANATDAAVQAGIDVQTMKTNPYNWKFNGPTIYVYPAVITDPDKPPEEKTLRLDYDDDGNLLEEKKKEKK